MRARAPGRVLALGALLALAACRSTPQAGPGARAGFVRALALPPVAPSPYGTGDLAGHVVLVSFTATWCFPCVAEIPNLVALQRELGPAGLRIVAVGMDLEGEQVLGPFADFYALNYPLVVADEPMRRGQSPFGPIRALPTTFLLDRRGAPVSAWQGVAGHGEVEAAVREALRR